MVVKMRNIKFAIMYDGSGYSGWQRVNNVKATKPSIQGLLEQIFSEVLLEPIVVVASGRTDAGVHAIQQIANFFTQNNIDLATLEKTINKALPEDIRIYSLEEVPKSFHSRYDAKQKTYEYRISTRDRESVFTRKYVYPLNESLHINKMKAGAKYLIGKHDFKAFSTDRKDGKSTERTIYDIQITEINNNFGTTELSILITGDGFLYHMVRIIAGTLVEIGLLKRSPESIKEVLASKERTNAGMMLGSQGLFLKDVKY